MSASALIADVKSRVMGEPVYLAGSLMAELTYGKDNAHHDVDLFCPTPQVLISIGQKLLGQGFKFDDRMDRVWHRWMRYGFKTWHTNSLRLVSPEGVDYNVVYKLTDGHPTTSLAQVLESFDFGLLGTGIELESGMHRDLRPYLFPGYDLDGALPMMPNKWDQWAGGFISRYNGLREIGRYAKYHSYGYDMSLVKDQLVQGYRMAALYLCDCFEQEKQDLGKIYEVIAAHLEWDNITELAEASKKIDYNDQLDVIMAALE